MNNNDHLNHIISKLDKLDERQDRMESTLIRQTAGWEEHIRRTQLLEDEVKPIKAHVQFMNNTAKVISVVVAAVLAAKSLGLF